MSVYYNENDAKKAHCLRQFIRDGLIAPGEVDERSITEVRPADLAGFAQCHFFAGFGVWSYALRLAGWPDDRPVWTGSCPCPSFSCAGKGKGFDDPRHLWPAWFGLIRECQPATIFGEQADDAIGYGWLDLVQSDLESASFAVGKAVLGACSVGAPHIRQRLYFCAYAESGRSQQFAHAVEVHSGADADGRIASDGDVQRSGQQRLLAEDCGTGEHSNSECDGRIESAREIRARESVISSNSQVGCGSNSSSERIRAQGQFGADGETRALSPDAQERERIRAYARESGATRGFWADCDWWYGRDGKYRPIEPGVFPLAHGASNRVLKLRGYGDAIVAPVAAEFIQASEEAVAV